MPSEEVQPVLAAGVVIMNRSEPKSVLLLKHKDRWDLPKGHAEPGENILQTALRETEEETGIQASQLAVDPSFQFDLEYQVEGRKRGKYLKRVSYFLAFIEGEQQPKLTEHIGFQWFPWPMDPIQGQTIDPLLTAVKNHLAE